MSTTIQRPPRRGDGRSPSRLAQPAAPDAGSSPAPLAPPARRSAATLDEELCGLGFDERLGRGKRVGEPGGRGDHRGVVGAQRERHQCSMRQRRAELGVRSHTTDNGNPIDARGLSSLTETLGESQDDRPLIRRREVGAAPRKTGVVEVPDGIEE